MTDTSGNIVLQLQRRPVLANKPRAGVSRRLVDSRWISASTGATSMFSELVRAISNKAAKNDKPKRKRL